MRLGIALCLVLWCVTSPAPEAPRTEGRILIDYRNTGGDAAGKPEGDQVGLEGKIVRGESSWNHVVIEFTVRDPGRSSLIPFRSRNAGTVKKRIVLDDKNAELVYGLLINRTAFINIRRSSPPGVDADLAGGMSMGRVSALRFPVSENSFTSTRPLLPNAPFASVRLFDPALPDPDSESPGAASRHYKTVTMPLEGIARRDLVESAHGIGTTRTQFGIVKPGKAVARFVALGINPEGYVLGVLDSDLRNRVPRQPLPLRLFPLEALREARGRDYDAWKTSDEALLRDHGEQAKWDRLLADATVGRVEVSEMAVRSYVKNGRSEELHDEVPLQDYLGSQEVVDVSRPIASAADRCRRILGIEGENPAP